MAKKYCVISENTYNELTLFECQANSPEGALKKFYDENEVWEDTDEAGGPLTVKEDFSSLDKIYIVEAKDLTTINFGEVFAEAESKRIKWDIAQDKKAEEDEDFQTYLRLKKKYG